MEWDVLSQEDIGTPDETCVCRHEGLRYLNTIGNKVTGATLFPIGSTCVKKFDNDAMTTSMGDLYLLGEAAAAVRSGSLNREVYSRRLIELLGLLEVIEPENVRFLLRLFNRGPNYEMPRHVAKQVEKVVTTQIIPYLMFLPRRLTVDDLGYSAGGPQ